MKKAVFFDADGTITDIDKGIPQSTLDALKLLTDNGHYAFLCTGRCRAMLPDDLVYAGFSGIIASCGSYIELKNRPVFNIQLKREDARKTVEILRSEHMVPVMEGPNYMYFDLDEYTEKIDWFVPQILDMLGDKWKPIAGNLNQLDINKISAKRLPGCDTESVCSRLAPWFDPIIHESGLAGSTIEFIPAGHSKATGIKNVCEMLDIPWEDTICFGDSNNDLQMFEYVHTKVAMGNSTPKIIELADYVTDDMFHDGIWNGLKHLNLI